MSRLITLLLLAFLPMTLHAAEATPSAAPGSEGTTGAPTEITTPDDATSVGEVRRGMVYGGLSREERERRSYQRVIQFVEPDFVGKPERIPAYIALFKREMVGDTNLFATNIEGTFDDSGTTLTLTGYVNYAENLNALGRFFHYLGFANVDNQVELLPSKGLGDLKFAFVRVPRAFVFDKPGTGQRERMTEGSLGDPLFLLLEADGGDFLCSTREGYVGYIAGSDIIRADAAGFAAYQNGPKAILNADFTQDDIEIYAGSRLAYIQERAGTEAVLRLPTGEEVAVPKGQVTLVSGEPNPTALKAIEIAKSKLGTKYVWGGVTSEGVDCSGLVQSSYKPFGINLSRDAYMQAYSGALVATRWYREGMRPGDTMYFLGRQGKITHTAIYLGDNQFIQAAGSVKISSLDPRAPNYDEDHDRGFAFAKRLLE